MSMFLSKPTICGPRKVRSLSTTMDLTWPIRKHVKYYASRWRNSSSAKTQRCQRAGCLKKLAQVRDRVEKAEAERHVRNESPRRHTTRLLLRVRPSTVSSRYAACTIPASGLLTHAYRYRC